MKHTQRILQHYRFGTVFAWINRHLRSRRNAIKKIRLLYQEYGLVENGCTLCGGKKFTLIAQGDRYGFDLKKQFCNQCHLIQTYPALSEEFHQAFYRYHYRPLYLKNKVVDYNCVIKEQSDKGTNYLNYFQQNGLENTLKGLSIIEVGCSSGGTLNTLKPFVKSVQGCDLDINAVKFAQKEFAINAEVAMYPSTLPNGRKLFIMSHVLEHVFNPLNTLQTLRQLMREGDYLFIAVPGINMVAKGAYKNDLRRYFHIAHVSDFTESTLSMVAQQAGFNTIASDEEINGLFIADKSKSWHKSKEDLADKLLDIEKTYHGKFPHL